MKKHSGLFLAALLGGLLSVGIVKLTESPTQNITIESVAADESSDYSSSNTLTANPPMVPAAPIDLTTAANTSLNAVVHVKTKSMVESNYYSYDNLQDFFFGPQRHSEMRPSLGSGSGVVISSDGYIVTNNHVISDADNITVAFNDKKEFDAELIGVDPSTDLALLKIEAGGLDYVPYGDSDNLQIGEWVLAVGNPFNLTSTVTAGIVSAKGRDINILKNDRISGHSAVESFIQTDAAVNPGNSGGALVNAEGNLIGINTAIKSNTGSYTGYSFAIPVNIVRKVVDDLLEYGVVQRAYIGVMIRNVDQSLATDLGLKTLDGVFVTDLTENGAAREAGMREGDVITKVGSIPVNEVPELQEQVSKFRPGDKVMVTVLRDGNEKVLPVVLKNKDGSTALVEKETIETESLLGAVFRNASNEERSSLGIDGGVKISELSAGKLRSAGIREGFIITQIDKQSVNEVNDVHRLLKDKKGGVLIEGVYPNGMGAYYGFGM